MKKPLRVLGAMTGTSCDGLDAACIQVDRKGGWTPLWSASAAFPAALRKRVLDVQRPGALFTSRKWLELDRDLGEWYGSLLAGIIRKSAGRAQPDVIANHGQTIAHFPQPRRQGVTSQLGDPTRIARATGLTVVSEFRSGDMAAGGEGAPLVPRFHAVLAEKLGDRHEGLALHNLGGFSNLSYFGPGQTLALDTGPASIWIDAACSLVSRGKLKMDRGGKLAARGTPDETSVRKLLRHPYFLKSAPKSTGRDDFPISYFTSRTRATGANLVATATAVTVRSIVDSYQRFILRRGLPLSRIFFCGGGAGNTFLLDGVRRGLPGIRVEALSAEGFDPRFIEAQAFAYYGFLSLAGKPLGGIWTGARGFAPPGQIVPGANWAAVVRKI